MEDKISFSDFEKIDIRVGTVVEASVNKGARKPAYKLRIDFGKTIGEKWSSAQITDYYTEEELVGKQIIAVMNFEPIRISEVKSEVLVLGINKSTDEKSVILLIPDKTVENGGKVY